MHIWIVCALPVEQKHIEAQLQKIKKKYYQQQVIPKVVSVGVWVESSVYSLSQKIAQTQNKPDYILNIGVCGVVSSPEEVLPVIQAYRTIKRSTEKELVTPLTHMSYPLKTILCSDLVVTADDQMGKHEYVDMESYGIAYVCEKEKIPYSIIKSVFDTVGPLSKQVDLWELRASLSKIELEKVLDDIVESNIASVR